MSIAVHNFVIFLFQILELPESELGSLFMVPKTGVSKRKADVGGSRSTIKRAKLATTAVLEKQRRTEIMAASTDADVILPQ